MLYTIFLKIFFPFFFFFVFVVDTLICHWPTCYYNTSVNEEVSKGSLVVWVGSESLPTDHRASHTDECVHRPLVFPPSHSHTLSAHRRVCEASCYHISPAYIPLTHTSEFWMPHPAKDQRQYSDPNRTTTCCHRKLWRTAQACSLLIWWKHGNKLRCRLALS